MLGQLVQELVLQMLWLAQAVKQAVTLLVLVQVQLPELLLLSLAVWSRDVVGLAQPSTQACHLKSRNQLCWQLQQGQLGAVPRALLGVVALRKAVASQPKARLLAAEEELPQVPSVQPNATTCGQRPDHGPHKLPAALVGAAVETEKVKRH